MKKVVRIIGRLNVGGPAIHTILLTHLLDETQYRSRLVTGVEGVTIDKPAAFSFRFVRDLRFFL